ncbi:MAG TPA: hypothetical protein DET40_13350 [Lentisphaeria bacterium]|nr:MAG: hypothetical protein A2X45_01335 [Lentisphaerae bacterium GWF2_50_93]HCE44527.1 hypothetical protein [Lentisphaeria bacterium]
MKNIFFATAMAVLMTAVSCKSVSQEQDSAVKADPSNPESSLLILKNQEIVLGILPDVGGHIVLLRSVDGKNILQTDPKLWSAPAPMFSVEKPPFLGYNGHIYWLGPQKGWWSQQDLNADKKKQNATWPPDPYLTLAKYEIVAQTADSVKLKSPASPVSGLQMLKEFSIKGNKVFLKVTATNIRDSEVSWDIWSNTRLPGNANVYVPASKEGGVIKIEFTAWTPDKDRVLPYDITDGFLHHDAGMLAADKEHVFTSKTYMYPSAPCIAAFCNGYLFIKKSELVPKNKIHPDQAFVEIYKLTGNIQGTLSELEMHGAYSAVKPGESVSFEENWELIPCKDLPGTADRIKFLKEKLK